MKRVLPFLLLALASIAQAADHLPPYLLRAEAQVRVTGTCTAGNAIRVIAADGTVTCQSASGGGGGGGGAWGEITGTLSDQTDLQAALDLKVPTARTVNGHALSSNITVTASDVGAPSGSGTSTGTNTGDQDLSAYLLSATAASTYQPLDSDLTAIAALSTTSFGRSVLTQADAAAERTLFGLGTLATQSGTFSGTSSGTNTGDQDLSGYLLSSTAASTYVPQTTTVNGQALSGNVTVSTITGNAGTATALAANGSNCTAGNFPLGVDASGASESCTALPTTIAGTANQITASASTGAITLSIPSSPTLPGTTTGTFSGNLTGNVTGNASTATALAANPTDCSASQYATAIAASGNLTCATIPYADLSGTPSLATVATSGSASDLGSGTVAAARGGAGTISGALKGNGSGVVSQAACSDLSNGATGCSTATGTSGATIPLLNGANTWSGVQSVNSGDLALKGATSGTLTVNAAATAGTNTLTLPAGTTDFSSTGGTEQFVKQGSAGGALTVVRPTCSTLSNAAASCSTDTTVATNISSGTLASARLPNGTAFPVSPSTNDRFFRTNIAGGMEFFYDGTRWLSTQIFRLAPSNKQAAQPMSASTIGAEVAAIPYLGGGSDIYLLNWHVVFIVNSGGTALGASHNWVIDIGKFDSSLSETSITTVTVNSGSSGVARNVDVAINATISASSFFYFGTQATKTGTPGSLYEWSELTYRIVAT